jgi:hypothetical protein
MERSVNKSRTGVADITISEGIKWIAEPVDNPEEIMKWIYKGGKVRSDSAVADLMRAHFPLITNEMLEGKAKNVRFVRDGTLLLATPPRIYEEWIYDFLKCDICVIGPEEKEAELRKIFNEKVKASISAKKMGMLYVQQIKPYLDALVMEGLVGGVLGRGSYFGKNGFPIKNDDIDFMLLVDGPENEDEIVKELKKIPRFAIALVKRKDTVIKEGKRPELSFIIISRDMAINGRGILYEKYVLEDSVGIELDHLTKEESENLAHRFKSLLPKEDRRAGIPRLPE